VDFFAPFDASSLDIWDADFASGGVTGLPDEYFGTESTPHLAVAVGKDGYVYLLNRDDLGGIGQGSGGSDAAVQRIGPYGGVWSRPGVWPGEGGWIYIPTASGGESSAGSSGNLKVYQYGLSGSGTPSLSLQGTSSEPFGFSSSSPVVTSDGTKTGTALVWIVWAPNASGAGAQLRAYYPVPEKGEPVMAWSAPVGTAAKFAPPGVAAGRLYVGTRDGHVLAFGSPVKPALEGSATSFPTTTDGQSNKETLTLTASEPLKVVKLESSSSQFQLGEPSVALPAELKTGEKVEVPITFAPTGTGPIGGMLTVSFDVGETEQTATFGLTGTGQAAAAKLERTPPLVSFGGTSVGGELSAGATFRNVGGTPLTIEHVNPPSAPFSAEGAPVAGSEIQPGGSITVTVAFKPTEVGNFESEIGLETSAGKAAVGLSGSASTPGQLRFSSEKVEYGEVPLGTTASRTFTIENAGGTTVTITKSKPPDGGEFHATSTLGEGTTIKPGESLSETVAFSPTAAGPAVPGVWHITGDDTTGPHEIELDGVGLATLTTPLPEGHTEMLAPEPVSPQSRPQQPAHATSAPVPDVTLASLKLRARRKATVIVRLRCPRGVGRCIGTITLSTSRKVYGRQPASRLQAVSIALASGSFSLAGGSTTLARLRLSKPALALLAHVHVLHAIATIRAHDPAGDKHTTRQHATIT
jgi:iron transport multicopper oxidase